MAAKQSKAAIIVKKKVWVPIIAPDVFNNQQIGETYLEEPQLAIGRRVAVSLMMLTGDPQRQNVTISFQISRAENNQLFTKVVGYSIVPVVVRKMMRRGRERVDDSFVVKTQDDVAVRVKPVLITRGRAKSSVLIDLRKTMRAHIARALANTKFIDFIKELVAHKFQRELQDVLRKIYPLQVCELRDAHIETGEKGRQRILAAPASPVQPAAEQPPAREAPASEAA